MSLPFTAATPVLLPLEAFPTPELQARARKLPMWDADRDMAVMRVQSQREYLGSLRQKVLAETGRGGNTVAGVHELVPVEALRNRYIRQSKELAWEEALLVRNDLLLQEAQ